ADLFPRKAHDPVLPPVEIRGGRSAAGGGARPSCRRWGCSAAPWPVETPGLFCCRWRCSAALWPVVMPGLFCRPWGCPAVLPPVEIRGGPLCRRFLLGRGAGGRAAAAVHVPCRVPQALP